MELPNVLEIGNENSRHAVLFLHEPGLGAECFLPFLSGLKADARLVLYTQGTVLPFDRNKGAESLLAELAAIVDSLAPRYETVLFGHALGAALALEYQRLALRKSPLILCSWIYDSAWAAGLAAQPGYAGLAGRIARQNAVEAGAAARLRNRYLAHAPYYFTDDGLESGMELLQRVSYQPEVAESLERGWLTRIDYARDLMAAGYPVLSLVGQYDRVTPTEYHERIARMNPRIDHHMLVECGHFPFVEDEFLFCAKIRGFLATLATL